MVAGDVRGSVHWGCHELSGHQLCPERQTIVAGCVHSGRERLHGLLAGHGLALDTTDARFQPMFTSPDFALDPTDPRYKQLEATGATARVAAERRRREQQPQDQRAGAAPAGPRTPTAWQSNGNTDSRQLQAVVAQLKRKSMAAQKPR